MKKLVSLLLAVCLCLSVVVMLTACGHEHTYKTEWSKDATHHWHACEGEDCTSVADKAVHTWNDGEITTAATAEADGVKTFTCTACGQTKTAPVEYTAKATVTKEEWETAFVFDVDVFQVTEEYSGSYGEIIAYYDTTRVVANDGTDRFAIIYLKETADGYDQYYTEVSSLSDVDTADNFTMTFVTENTFISYFKMTLSQFIEHYDKFDYDEAQRCYVASGVNDEILSATVYFADGKITKIQYTDSYDYSTEYEISYDDVALTLPSAK